VLPLYFSLRLLTGSRLSRRIYLLEFARASAALIAGLVLMSIILDASCVFLGARPTVYTGRQGSYRMWVTARLVPEDQRQAWIDSLAARSEDPAVAFAIRTMCIEQPWAGAWQKLQSASLLWARDVDEVEDEAFRIYGRALDDPWIRKQWFDHFAALFDVTPARSNGIGPGGDGIWLDILKYSRWSLGEYHKPALATAYPWLDGAVDPQDTARFDNLLDRMAPDLSGVSGYFTLVIPLFVVCIGSGLLIVVQPSRRAQGHAGLALAGAVFFYLGASTYYHVLAMRNLMPATTSLFCALVLIARYDSGHEPRRS
jgi:hypothetical protein